MKPTTIFIIFIIAVISYAVFEQYLTKGDLLNFLQLQANVSQEKPIEKETTETNEPLTVTASQPIKQKSNPNSTNTNPKEEVVKETVIQETIQETTDISPYYGKVKISSIQAETKYHPSLIRLRVNIYPGDKINITGWRIKTRKGEIVISKGIEKYQNYAVPHDIIIKESLYIYLIGDSNPLGRNKNFRPNKCFGYLKSRYSFYPSFYSYCPKPKLEDISHLNPYCQEFILHSYGCKMPNYSKDFKISTDQECVSYIIDYFTYNACFKRYSKEDNFLKNYWYVYLGTNIVEPLHDTIYLYDPNGLIVDKYMY